MKRSLVAAPAPSKRKRRHHHLACTKPNKDNLKVWWEACELAALVLPSSGTEEHVFLLVNLLFSDQQSRLLSDAIRLGLFLAFNKRGE